MRRCDGLIDGRQMKAARAILNLSQEGAAELAGLHRNSVYRLESKEALPRRYHAGDRLAEALEPLGITFGSDNGEAIVRFKPAAGQGVKDQGLRAI